MFGIIYKLTNTMDGVSYVGQTTKSLGDRIGSHNIRSRRNPACRLHIAIQKHGIASFVAEQIDAAETQKELDDKECFWIRELGTLHPGGYNHTVGGRGIVPVVRGRRRPEVAERNRQRRGAKWPEEAKLLRRLNGKRGKDHKNFGRQVSEETRKKMSESAKARPPMSDERRQKLVPILNRAREKQIQLRAQERARRALLPPPPKIRRPRKAISDEFRRQRSVAYTGETNPFFGRTHSAETKRLISEKASARQVGERNPFYGKTHSEETRAKLRAARDKQVISPESRAKAGAALKGRKLSDEVRSRMKAAQQGIDRPWLRGRKLSEETKRRIADARRGTQKINGRMVKIAHAS